MRLDWAMFACSITPYSHGDAAKRLLKKLGGQGGNSIAMPRFRNISLSSVYSILYVDARIDVAQKYSVISGKKAERFWDSILKSKLNHKIMVPECAPLTEHFCTTSIPASTYTHSETTKKCFIRAFRAYFCVGHQGRSVKNFL